MRNNKLNKFEDIGFVITMTLVITVVFIYIIGFVFKVVTSF